GGNRQFLVQFAAQSIGRQFAGLDLAAWELPFQRMRVIGPALADQDTAVALDDGRHHRRHSSPFLHLQPDRKLGDAEERGCTRKSCSNIFGTLKTSATWRRRRSPWR